MNKINKMLTSIIVELPFFLDMVVKIPGKFQVMCPLLPSNLPQILSGACAFGLGSDNNLTNFSCY